MDVSDALQLKTTLSPQALPLTMALPMQIDHHHWYHTPSDIVPGRLQPARAGTHCHALPGNPILACSEIPSDIYRRGDGVVNDAHPHGRVSASRYFRPPRQLDISAVLQAHLPRP